MKAERKVTSFRLTALATRQLAELTEKLQMNQSEIVSTALDRIYQQEIQVMNSQPSTVTLKFVAQSGHAWEETVNVDEIDDTVEQTVATHGDIERVEKLADPNDASGETIWKFE